MTVGSGELTFKPVPGWPDVPPEAGLIEAIGVAVDSRDRVFVFARAELPVLIFEADGSFAGGWGEGQFLRPHGITIASDDTLYLTDDLGHSVRQFTTDGKLLQTIGPSGAPANTGADGFDYRTIRPEAGPPFNLPTNLIVGPGGDLFVTDGYGNARVHRFSVDGEYRASWGAPGDQPGQFQVPHGIGDDLARPAQVYISADGHAYVFELGYHTGIFPWHSPDKSKPGGRLSIFDLNGQLLTRWGGDGFPTTPDGFYAPHDLCLDSRGNLYTAEVKAAAASFVGDDTSALPSLRKFVRCM
jgi:hypothetical protein